MAKRDQVLQKIIHLLKREFMTLVPTVADTIQKRRTKPKLMEMSCQAETLVKFVKMCNGKGNAFCQDVRSQAARLYQQINGWDI